ncbi:GAF domain-containing protein [Williamsia deligens]|uniref:GAF domain-containing protein n=1 Tax=Williamsia deligens TaxID=321325 RepID=A0ABW3G6T7_9NOCA|nr:GAF domain-containing protein [Williamsia deligens]MCP2192800.1 GAF domain-containing protein [Williamsia deligens]
MTDDTPERLDGLLTGTAVVAVADIVHTMTGPFDVAAVLDAVADAARRGFGAYSSSVVVLDRSGPSPSAHAVAVAGDIDPALSTWGPGLTAAGDGAVAVIGDLGVENDRWPRYRADAHDAGLRSVHAFPIRVLAQPVGSVVVYTTEPWGDHRPVVLGQMLADLAALALTSDATGSRDAVVETVVGRLLRDTRTVGLAVGIAAEVLELDPGAARRELAHLAASHRTPFAMHARAVVDAHDRRVPDHGGLLRDPYTR